MNDAFEIKQGDCLQVLKTLENGIVDVVITDPPYGETSLDWDVSVNWLGSVRRILKPSGSVWFFTSVRHLLSIDLSGWKFAQDIVWEKHNGSNFHADRFRRVHELAVQIYPDNVMWRDVYKKPVTTLDATKRTVRRKRRPTHTGNIAAAAYESFDGGPRLQRSVIRVRSCHGKALHPTQKPTGIIEPLIEYSCPPKGIVLDPFCGSASVGVAALQMNRRYLGIELNPEYIAMSEKRLSEIQVKLF